MSKILQCEALYKSYVTGDKTVEVLKGIDLEVDEGELCAIVGESGVGKSTLLHVIGAIDRPDSGKIFIRETDIFSKDAYDLAAVRNREIGFVFQFHHLLPEFDALENVMMPFLIRGIARSEASRSAEEILKDLGLAERLRHKPFQLSGGEQQRVAIARAIVVRPSIVLADEPTGNLDPRTGHFVFEQMRKVQKSRNLAIILATHNEGLARKCDRIFRIEDGRLRELQESEIKKYFEISPHWT
jgi:lipoprotein-releasing system ATP-binding protein